MSGRAKRERLADYLQKEGSPIAFTITDRAGWNGEAYILAGGEAVNADGTNILYNGDTSQKDGYTENREPKSRRLSETGGKHK